MHQWGNDRMHDIESRRILEHAVVVYVTPHCGLCRRTLALLHSHWVEPMVVDVSGTPRVRRWLRELTGQRTVPQVFIRGECMGGYSELLGLDVCGCLEGRLAKGTHLCDVRAAAS